ncbi:MAG: hypothetical protein ACRD1Z_05085, partial [Vicinamibacteria bacterium]
DKFKRLREDFYRGQRDKMNGVIRKYRRYLETFYGNNPARPLLPMLAFVPISDKTDGLYFQGLLDADTLKLVVGEPEDEELYNETIFIRTKPQADLNARVKRASKVLSGMPGINKDIAHRAALLASGQVPDRIEWKGE